MDMSVIMLDSLRWGGGRILWRVREKGGSDEPPEPPPLVTGLVYEHIYLDHCFEFGCTAQ